MENQTNILLEAGTNELEIMVLDVGGRTYGVNIAKVREVILPQKVRPVPQAIECIEGVFLLRDRVVELIDLKNYLGTGSFTPEERKDQTRSQIVVTEFNAMVVGFRVTAVEKIVRTSWDCIESVPSMCAAGGTPLVGLANIDDRIVQMLDLERIVLMLSREKRMITGDVAENNARRTKRVLVAEDSAMIRKLMLSELAAAGYSQTVDFHDGLQAWQYIEKVIAGTEPPLDLVVSDIEMPQLDGLHLCKRIRQTPMLAEIPVILFSSLINPANLNKGHQVGASAQIAKPELAKLVRLADGFLGITEPVATATS